MGANAEDLSYLNKQDYCTELSIQKQEKPPEPQATISLNDKHTLFTTLNRLSAIVDQCFNWNIFTTSSRDVLTKYIGNIRTSIAMQSSNRFEVFKSCINLILQSLEKYTQQIRQYRESNQLPSKQLQVMEQTVTTLITEIQSLGLLVESAHKAHLQQSQPSQQRSQPPQSRKTPSQPAVYDVPTEPQDVIGGEIKALFLSVETNEMDFGETYNTEIFHTYMPQKVDIGNLHPDPVVETSYETGFSNHE